MHAKCPQHREPTMTQLPNAYMCHRASMSSALNRYGAKIAIYIEMQFNLINTTQLFSWMSFFLC